MALNRWSLDRLLTWIGTAALIVLFVPMGLYLMMNIATSTERNLFEHGQSIASTLGEQIVDILLLNDRLSLYDVITKAASADNKVIYISIENEKGTVVAHTFPDKHPRALQNLWRSNYDQTLYFRTQDGPVIDISIPIVSGQLGSIHVGLSRIQAVEATYQLMWFIGISLSGALMIVFAGAHFVAVKMSRPLRKLESVVSQFPQKSLPNSLPGISGTSEVKSLAFGITEMVRRLNSLEHERAITQAHMVHTERLAALGELTAGLTHEIRNPLDGMLECVRYLETDEKKGKRSTKFLPMIRVGLERINEVMQHTLTFARSGNDITFEVCATSDIVNSLELMLHGKLKSNSIRLTWHKPGTCKCLCNKQEVLQSLLNLVLNAVEAVQECTDPEIVIEAKCDSQWVYLAVGDNGCGIPEKLRDKIFKPFFTTRPIGKGTGLGLSISRQLVRAVGGELDLSPEPSPLGGANFIIRVPRMLQEERRND
ncbi:ATP-binding protein [Candidatus Latescibacterota bacterium]